MSYAMHFEDLAPLAIPVTIGTKRYLLREATADIGARYRNAAAQCAKFVDGKMSGVGNVGDIEPFLVSLCLAEVTDTGEKALEPKTIRLWPAKTVKALFDKAKEISHLDETETVEVLEKRLAETQKKLDALRGDAEGNGQLVSGATTFA